MPPCRKNEILDTRVQNIDNPQKWDAEVKRPQNIENKTRVNDFSGKFPENGKLENIFDECETPKKFAKMKHRLYQRKRRRNLLYALFLGKFEKF